MIIRVVDIETCGLPPDNMQVVEIATVDLMSAVDIETPVKNPGTVWTRGRMWTSLVNPGRPIPPEASAVHHITDDMVRDAPTIDAVMPMVVASDAGVLPSQFAAHEAKFEKACLPWLAERIRLCTRKCAATAWPDAPNHKNQTLRYWLGLKLVDPTLTAPHRALGDAYVTAAILRRLFTMPVSLDDWMSVSANPVLLSRFNFGKHAMQPLADVPVSYFDWLVNKSGFDDEDVIFTARHYLDLARHHQQNRSPVSPEPPH